MAISSPGIGSNLDINGIVAKLISVESRPLTLLDQREASYQARLTAYGTLSGALSTFQNTLAGLSDPKKFTSLTATSTDTAILTATAASGAVAASYAVQVNQLAQAQNIAAAGQTSTTASIGSGATTTLSFQFGTISGGTLTNGIYSGAAFTQDASQATGTLTISSANNSLAGIRDAINSANIGVTATIVNDGSASPYRLVLTSNKTGAASSLKITVSGDAALQGLLAYDPAGTQNLTQTSAAQNATLTISGIAVTSATNSVSGAIQGVTLNLAKVGTVNLGVAYDSASAQNAAQSFVKAYNDVNSTLSSLLSYNATTKQGGPLLGDSAARNIQTRIRQVLTSSLTGLSGNLTLLSQIGVSFQKDGTLGLDATKLQNALSNNFGDIDGLFAAVGKASDSLVGYVSSTQNTKPGSYPVNVTALATRGAITGSAAAGLTITTGANDQLAVTVDGVSATVTLGSGTYTASSLAAQVQSAINGAAAFSSAGIAVTATQSAGVITIASNRYGSASSVAVSGSGAANLLGAAPVSTAGVDAAGTINGVTATGSGQFLTGATGNPAEGLKIQITGGATGARGTINFSQGYAYRLNSLVNGLLGSQGVIASRTDGINSTIKSIASERAAFNRRLAEVEKRYRAQFTALDTLISSMTQTSNFLQQQLANLPKNKP